MKSFKLMVIIVAGMLALAGCAGQPPVPPAPTAGGPTAPLPTLPGSGEEGEGSEATEATLAPEALETAEPLAGLNFRDGWARIPFNFSVFGGYGADQINDVVAGGPGVVAVGFEVRSDDINGAAWYSADGVGWYRIIGSQELAGPGVQSINAVASGARGLIAVGMEKIAEDENAAAWFSSDGMNWVRVRPGGDVFGDDSSQVMEDVVAFGDGFVAVGVEKTDTEVRGAVWTSSDGTNWQRTAHSEAAFGGTTRFTTLTAIISTGSTLLAAGSVEPVDDLDVDAGVWLSEDGGQTWIPVEAPEAVLGDPGPVRFQLASGIAQGGAGFFMIATEQNLAGSPSGDFVNGLIWQSTDGLNWSRIFDHKPDLVQQSMLDIIASGLGYFAAGYEVVGEEAQAAVWFSVDGQNWAQVPHSEIVFGGAGVQRINALAEAGPGIIAVGMTTENGEQDAAAWILAPGR